jgi:hypothetical protein
MPAGSETERRDRALVAFTILTGARDGAIASFKLKHIDVDQGRLDQDARQVNTKFSKLGRMRHAEQVAARLVGANLDR